MVSQTELRKAGLQQRLQRQRQTKQRAEQARVDALNAAAVEAAAEQREQSILQAHTIDTRLAELNQQMSHSQTMKAAYAEAHDQTGQRQEQARQKQIQAEKLVLVDARENLYAGGTYENIQADVIAPVREYGRQVEAADYSRHKTRPTPPRLQETMTIVEKGAEFNWVSPLASLTGATVVGGTGTGRYIQGGEVAGTEQKLDFGKSTGGFSYVGSETISTPLFDLKPGETYSPELGGFISAAPGVPDVSKSTVMFRTPTPKETARLDWVKEQEAKQLTIGEITTWAGTGVGKFMEYKPVKAVTTTIRDIPIAVPQFTWDVGKKKVVKTEFEYPTIGESLVRIGEKIDWGLETSKEGWGDIRSTLFKAAEKREKGPVKHILQTAGYLTFGGTAAASVAKPVVGYTLAPVAYAGAELLTLEQKIAKPEKYIKEQVTKQYKLYEEQYTEAKKDLKEGYELEPKLTKTEFVNQADIKNQTLSSFRKQQVIPFIIFAGGIGIKTGRGLFKQRVVKDTLKGGKVVEKPYVERQQMIGGEKVARYKIYSEVKPVTVQTRSIWAKVIGKKAKTITIRPGAKYVTQPVKLLKTIKKVKATGKPVGKIKFKKDVAVKIDEPYWIETARVGKAGKLVSPKYSLVAGRARVIPKAELLTKAGLKKLPKVEKYMILGKRGKVVDPLKVKKADVITVGEVGRIKFAKPSVITVGKDIKVTKAIIRPTGFEGAKVAETIRKTRFTKLFAKYKIKDVSKIYKAETFFKGISKAKPKYIEAKIGLQPKGIYYRFKFKAYPKPVVPKAAGKLFVRKGTIIKYPSIKESGIISTIGTGKKSSAAFLKQMWAKEVPVAITKAPPITKPPIIKAGIITKTVIPATKQYPLMVGGGVTTLETTGFATGDFRDQFATGDFQDQFDIGVTRVAPDVTPKIAPAEDVDVSTVPKTGLGVISSSRGAQAPAQAPALIVTPKQIQQVKQILQLKPTLRQEILQSQRISPPRSTTKIRPIFDTGRKKISPKMRGLFLRAAYRVEVRRRGKFVQVGKKLLPMGRALRLGTKETTTTLAQTFRLLKKGVTMQRDIRFKVPTQIFTLPKKRTAKIEFVERRGKTLKKGTGEIPSILKTQSRYKFLGSKKRGRKNVFGI